MVKFGRHLRGQSESISVIVMSEAGNAVNVVLMAVRDLFFGCINLFSTAFGALERSMNSVFFYSFIVGGPLATYAIFRFIGPFSPFGISTMLTGSYYYLRALLTPCGVRDRLAGSTGYLRDLQMTCGIHGLLSGFPIDFRYPRLAYDTAYHLVIMCGDICGYCMQYQRHYSAMDYVIFPIGGIAYLLVISQRDLNFA